MNVHACVCLCVSSASPLTCGPLKPPPPFSVPEFRVLDESCHKLRRLPANQALNSHSRNRRASGFEDPRGGFSGGVGGVVSGGEWVAVGHRG